MLWWWRNLSSCSTCGCGGVSTQVAPQTAPAAYKGGGAHCSYISVTIGLSHAVSPSTHRYMPLTSLPHCLRSPGTADPSPQSAAAGTCHQLPLGRRVGQHGAGGSSTSAGHSANTTWQHHISKSFTTTPHFVQHPHQWLEHHYQHSQTTENSVRHLPCGCCQPGSLVDP